MPTTSWECQISQMSNLWNLAFKMPGWKPCFGDWKPRARHWAAVWLLQWEYRVRATEAVGGKIITISSKGIQGFEQREERKKVRSSYGGRVWEVGSSAFSTSRALTCSKSHIPYFLPYCIISYASSARTHSVMLFANSHVTEKESRVFIKDAALLVFELEKRQKNYAPFTLTYCR